MWIFFNYPSRVCWLTGLLVLAPVSDVSGDTGVVSSLGGVLSYRARTADARWQASSGTRRCELEQIIPGFGLAGFLQKASGKLHFVLTARQPPLDSSFVEIGITTPAWLNRQAPELLVEARTSLENPIVEVGGPLALRLYNALQNGMAPRLRYASQKAYPQNVEVRVSPVRFRSAATDFRRCLASLASEPEAVLQASFVYFATDSADLTQSARALLDRLAAQFINDDGMSHVRVEGYADVRGEEGYNQRLSERRAFAVRFYLVSRGVPIDAIELRSFGAHRPLLPGDGESIWAHNRRVHVTLSG